MPTPGLEVWGGLEYTVNRVDDTYFDQMAWSGHDQRLDDLEMIANLGIRTLRYPVLWERVAPGRLEDADWRWSDERLARLRDLGIRPIVGLVHHGSGPRHTSLADPGFPGKLAVFARAVAERYPWVDAYTPVNEPLTTARFSGLYGHWYPHARDPRVFLRAMFHQVRGVQLAMQAIRAVQPAAQLVQTEDLGKIYSTPRLQYQADHENERRWLTFDLLAGRVDRHHPMFSYIDLFLPDAEPMLEDIRAQAATPDLLGINYYVTSERFLDSRLELYPEWMHGNNGRDRYVDVEAARVCEETLAGHAGMLREAWQRYGLPLALTEVHLGGTREHQLRWLMEAWEGANTARQEGIDVRAITAWALLGSFHWDTLVTRDDGSYESGAYDIRASQPRPTILARALESLARTGQFDHPALRRPGWWRAPERLLYPGAPCAPAAQPRESRAAMEDRPLLITGARGTLGRAFQRICELRGIPCVALTRDNLDITQADMVAQAIAEIRPSAIINAAGYVRVDQAEQEQDACFAINTRGPEVLAIACREEGLGLVTFSSDLVFDGEQTRPYLERDAAAPLNVYGRSKAEAEKRVLAEYPGALVVRTSAFFGPWDEYNFPIIALRALAAGKPFHVLRDATVSPTYVPDLVHASLDLLIDGEHGIWHLANPGAVTWYDLARQVAQNAGISDASLRPTTLEASRLAARRPRYSALGSERAWLLPPLENALFRFVQEQETARMLEDVLLNPREML